MKFSNAYDSEDGGWTLEVKHVQGDTVTFEIRVKEGLRRFRREIFVMTGADVVRLLGYLGQREAK